MSLRKSFLTKRYSNFFYFDHCIYIYTHTCIYMYVLYIIYIYMYIHAWATVCQSQHEVKTITVCQAFIMNSDAEEEGVGLLKKLEERETRLAKRRVADRARYAANQTRKTERRRERRAAECSEQRETRLARRRVADRARFAAISR